MAWLALLPGRLLERTGNSAPRGMVAHDRTRLIGRLPTQCWSMNSRLRLQSYDARLCALLKSGLLWCRYGDEEFVASLLSITLSQAMTISDAALYKAKAAGRNRVSSG